MFVQPFTLLSEQAVGRFVRLSVDLSVNLSFCCPFVVLLSVLPSLTVDFHVWCSEDIYEVTRRSPPLSVQFWSIGWGRRLPVYVHRCTNAACLHTSTSPPAACTFSRPPCSPVAPWPSIHRHGSTTSTSPGRGSGCGVWGRRWAAEPARRAAHPSPPLDNGTLP